MSVQTEVAAFIADVRVILAPGVTEATLRTVGDRLRILAQTPDLLPGYELVALHGNTASMMTLHSDGPAGLTLMLAQFPETAPTPIHDHNSWGVACVVSGRDHYQHFERLDDGEHNDHAQLRLLYERELAPGDVVVWLDPPHDIHCQRGIGGAAWELVLFGLDATSRPRRYFDLATGAVRSSMPQ
jgi:predicted metal-dependent enzyme (double-stranded beta helix superfamily)